MKLVLLTAEQSCENEVKCIKHALEIGFFKVHIRKPSWSFERLKELLLCFTEGERRKFSVHSKYFDSLALGIGGVHCTKRVSLDEEQKLKASTLLQDKPCAISKSCHSLEEVGEATDFSYVFLSPIFDSLSKPGYTSRFSMQALQNTVPNFPMPVFALGGVTAEVLPRVHDVGFAGAAILGSVWQSDKPQSALDTLLEAGSHA